jgi:hypothetical protein
VRGRLATRFDGTLCGVEFGIGAASAAEGVIRGIRVGFECDEAGVLAGRMRDVNVVCGLMPDDGRGIEM